MRVFVTGASGFIGSKFCLQAQAQGHQILPLQRPNHLGSLPYETIKTFAPEVVVHCAWIATPGIYTDSPENFLLQKQSVELFQWLSGVGVKHFIGCGTCAEYAPSRVPLDEDQSLLGPVSPYARAKNALHNDLKNMAAESSVAFTWARIFYPYGPNEHPDRLISSLLRGYSTGKRIEVRTPDAVRDYVHVADVASALLTLVEKSVEGSFNIGTGCGVSLGRLESMVAKLVTDKTLPKSSGQAFAENSNDQVVASMGKMCSLGWRPRYDLSAGLSTYVV